MKKKSRHLISVFVLAAVFLAGCQSKNEADSAEPSNSYGYNLTSDETPAEMSIINDQCTDGENIYISGMSGGGLPRFYKLLPDGNAQKLKVPSSVEYIYGLCFDGDLYMLCGDYPKSWKDAQGMQRSNDQEEYSIRLLRFDVDGNLLEEIELTGTELKDGLRFSFLEKIDDKFYAMASRRLVCFDSRGQELDYIALDNSQFLTMCRWKGKLAVSCLHFDEDNFGCELSVIETADTISNTTIYRSVNNVVSGLGVSTDGRILIANEKGIYYLEEESGQTEALAMWSEMGALMPEYNSVIPYKDSYIVSAPGQQSIDTFSYGPLKETRQQLMLLTDSVSPGMKALINKFNQKNTEYYVVTELFDHKEEGAGDRLRARLASGTGPDIFSLYNDSDLESLNPESVYEDLYPYLDSDKDYSREDIFPSLLKAMEHKGRLYSMPYDFMIYTFFTTTDLDFSPQMTLKEFSKAAADTTDQALFSTWASRDGVWEWLTMCCLGSYINEDNYTCNFIDPSFISLLEVCKTIPEVPAAPNDESSVLRLDQVASFIHIGTLGDMFGTNYIFCGCPNGSGGGHCFETGVKYSMSAQSKNKEGAWQFIREVMSPRNDIYAFELLPASVEVFDTMVEIASTEGLNFPNYLKNPVTISQFDAQQLRSLIEETQFLPGKYPEIYQIIDEEVQKFFGGDRNAEDTAKLIQSRVSVFLSERFG